MVSAWTEQNYLVLGQRQVAEKSNEITAIPDLLHQHLESIGQAKKRANLKNIGESKSAASYR